MPPFYTFVCLLFQCSPNLQWLLGLCLQFLRRKCNQSTAPFWSNALYIVSNFLIFLSIPSSLSFLHGTTPASYHITNTALELRANITFLAFNFDFVMFISLLKCSLVVYSFISVAFILSASSIPRYTICIHFLCQSASFVAHLAVLSLYFLQTFLFSLSRHYNKSFIPILMPISSLDIHAVFTKGSSCFLFLPYNLRSSIDNKWFIISMNNNNIEAKCIFKSNSFPLPLWKTSFLLSRPLTDYKNIS